MVDWILHCSINYWLNIDIHTSEYYKYEANVYESDDNCIYIIELKRSCTYYSFIISLLLVASSVISEALVVVFTVTQSSLMVIGLNTK